VLPLVARAGCAFSVIAYFAALFTSSWGLLLGAAAASTPAPAADCLELPSSASPPSRASPSSSTRGPLLPLHPSPLPSFRLHSALAKRRDFPSSACWTLPGAMVRIARSWQQRDHAARSPLVLRMSRRSSEPIRKFLAILKDVVSATSATGRSSGLFSADRRRHAISPRMIPCNRRELCPRGETLHAPSSRRHRCISYMNRAMSPRPPTLPRRPCRHQF